MGSLVSHYESNINESYEIQFQQSDDRYVYVVMHFVFKNDSSKTHTFEFRDGSSSLSKASAVITYVEFVRIFNEMICGMHYLHENGANIKQLAVYFKSCGGDPDIKNIVYSRLVDDVASHPLIHYNEDQHINTTVRIDNCDFKTSQDKRQFNSFINNVLSKAGFLWYDPLLSNF